MKQYNSIFARPLFFVALSFFGEMPALSQNKLFVYYPTWSPPTMKPSDLKFPAGILTYYMHFSAHVSSTFPYFGPVVSGNSDSTSLANYQRALIDTCHRAGQKVLLSITAQGGDGTILKNVTNNVTQRKAFVSAVSSYCKRKGYDGIDLDWESDLDSAAVTRLIREFRDTLNTWASPGILTMATITDPFIYPGIWRLYNPATMNSYLDAYFPMNYVMNTAERSGGSLGNANNVWRCMFDCPYTRPTGAPWSGYTGGYWAADFKTNGIAKWITNGAARSKVGIGLWNGGSTMLNSNSSMVPGSPISYGTPGYVTYATVLTVPSNYDAQADSRWGIVNGRYCSWIDSAGAYKRTKWAKDTMQTNVFMLYDAYSGFIPTGQRYGRQPHFDAMVNAIRVSVSAPTATTGMATTIARTSATGNGTVHTNGAATTVRFVWGTSSGVYTDSALAVQSPIAFGSSPVSVGMTGLNPTTTYYYRVRAYNSAGNVQGGEVSFATTEATLNYMVASGWNLLSIPFTVADGRKTVLFPTSPFPAYTLAWGTGYYQCDTLLNRYGYWVGFGSAQNISISGFERTRDTINVHPGWNVIGSISHPVHVNSIVQVPAANVQSGFFAFIGDYVPITVIEPGKSYWVRMREYGVIILQAN